jgi:hypothetical protein
MRPCRDRKIDVERHMVGARVYRRRKIEAAYRRCDNLGMWQQICDKVSSSNCTDTSCRVTGPNNKICSGQALR